MRKFPKALAGIGVGAALAAGTFASAQFILNSTGDANGSVATPSSPTVAGTIQSPLWPGECNDVTVTFHNDNDHTVKILTDDVAGSINTDKITNAALKSWLVWNPTVGPSGNGVVASGDGTVAPGADATVTFQNAVCLSPDAGIPGGNISGADVWASVTIYSEVVAGTEFPGGNN